MFNENAIQILDSMLNDPLWNNREKCFDQLSLLRCGRLNLNAEKRIFYLRYNDVLVNSFSRKRSKYDEKGDL